MWGLQRTIGNEAVCAMLDRQASQGSRAVRRAESSIGETLDNARISQRPGGDRAPSRPGAPAGRLPGQVIRRHPIGTELPEKNEDTAEVAEALLPAATRTATKEKSEKADAKSEGTAFTAVQTLTPGAMSLSAAQKILQGEYGGIKAIVPGAIVVLADQPACSAKYDEVCIAAGLTNPGTGVLWAVGDRAAIDAAAGTTVEGFAWQGTVYVNGETTLVTATAHEILHNNTSTEFRKTGGETLNEGTTELLARRALVAAGIAVPAVTAYPEDVAIVERLEKVIGEASLKKAYFEDSKELTRAYATRGNGKGSWSQFRAAAEAKDMVSLEVYLKK